MAEGQKVDRGCVCSWVALFVSSDNWPWSVGDKHRLMLDTFVNTEVFKGIAFLCDTKCCLLNSATEAVPAWIRGKNSPPDSPFLFRCSNYQNSGEAATN